MGYIEIRYDRNNGLTAVLYYSRNGKIVSKRKIDKENLRLVLSELSKEEIRTKKIVDGFFEYIVYNDVYIKVYNYRLVRKCGLLRNYFNKVDEQIMKKKNQLASKVKRKNKYVGQKITAAGISLFLLLSAMLVVMQVKDDRLVIANDDGFGYSQSTMYEHEIDKLNNNMQFVSEDTLYFENTGTSDAQSNGTSADESIFVENDYKEEETSSYIYIDYNDRSDYEKTKKTRQLYGDIIEKYARMYGLDCNLVIALATQERGIHSSEMDRGGATGLMQIQNSVWVGHSITAYNFETGQKETFDITKSTLADCETNIKIGCMILQDCMRRNNYNILLGLQAYNMGTSGIRRAVEIYANSLNCSKEDVINNINYCGWMDYREGIAGDPLYIEHVLSYIGNDINICIYKNDGTSVECFVRNYQNVKSR